MRLLFTILFILISLIGFTQTQYELNVQYSESYKKVDKKLNETYKAILSEYKSDTVFIKNLKASQRIWIMFRDAELKVKYPEREQGFYGSVFPMCVSNYLEKLTQERIKTLKEWIDGIEEGDVCKGSIKIKE